MDFLSDFILGDFLFSFIFNRVMKGAVEVMTDKALRNKVMTDKALRNSRDCCFLYMVILFHVYALLTGHLEKIGTNTTCT